MAETKTKRALVIRELGTKKEIKRYEFHAGESRHNIEKCMRGMLINMNMDKYYVDDSESW